MALTELRHCAARCARSRSSQSTRWNSRCYATASGAKAANASQQAQDANDLEQASGLTGQTESHPEFDPLAASRSRTEQLPSSRYQFRPPKYYRGPLHPHQPPPRTDPVSREFIPGPFSLPRAKQSYLSTIAPDLMTLTYHHYPPGYEAPPKAPRVRTWDDSSPYHKNRPVRKPRGGEDVRPLRQDVTFRNVPRLEKITVHSFVNEAISNSAPLDVATMALQAITGVRATTHRAKKSVVNWGLRKGRYVSVSYTLTGEYMYHFLGKLVDVVMPRIKDYRGVLSKSGDGSGSYNFGFTPEEVAFFPEIEVNYDFYPPKLLPGCHVQIKTSATSDDDAKLLLGSLGVPFDVNS